MKKRLTGLVDEHKTLTIKELALRVLTDCLVDSRMNRFTWSKLMSNCSTPKRHHFNFYASLAMIFLAQPNLIDIRSLCSIIRLEVAISSCSPP